MEGISRKPLFRAAAVGASALALLLLAVGSPARADPFGFDDIQYWVGSGQNEAALVVYWSDADLCLVWGYRFDGAGTGQQMLAAIAQGDRRSGPNGPVVGSVAGDDPRLGVQIAELGAGPVVFGLGYDVDNDGPFGYVNGADETGHAADPDDVYHEGWFNGFWNYRTSTDGQTWTSAETGFAARTLADGDWDAWVWDPTFSAIFDPPGIDPTGLTAAQPPGSAAELHWSGTSGEWSSPNWFDGSQNVSPQGGEAMVVDAGTVEVDGRYVGPLAADLLHVSAATVDILLAGQLETTRGVTVGPGGRLIIDGTLNAAELSIEPGDPQSGAPGGTLTGSGVVHAPEVFIRGVFSPGEQAFDVLGDSGSPAPLPARSSVVPEPGGLMLPWGAALCGAIYLALRRRKNRRFSEEPGHD